MANKPVEHGSGPELGSGQPSQWSSELLTGPSVPPFEALSTVWQTCLEQAYEAFTSGSLPIGAVITNADGEILAVGRNRLGEHHEHSPHLPGTPYITGSPLAHAEVNALLQLGNPRFEPRPVLYTTTEPCPLCMGAARMTGIGKVVYASRDSWAGAAMMAENIPYLQRMGPKIEGPIKSLEQPLMTWLLAVLGDHLTRTGPFMDGWRSNFPKATEVASRLHESQALREVADSGVAALWSTLARELSEAPDDD